MGERYAKGRVAGLLYVATGLTGAFNLLYIPSAFIVRGDPMATARRITEGIVMFRVAVLSGVVCGILFILLALSLYRLFEDVDREHARVMVLFIVVAVAMGLAIQLSEIATLVVLSGRSFLSAFGKPQLDALALSLLVLRSGGILLASAFWGLWLLPFGILVRKSGFFPRILGPLLIVAGVAYLAVSFTSIVFPTIQGAVSLVATPLEGLGEGAAVIWLLRGAREPVVKAASLTT
jgi:Domain of unknown function (DUF4386)